MTEERAGLPIIAFADSDTFDRWLAGQAENATGLWLKFAKAGTGIVSITKSQAIDTALCHGWIDGQLDKYDDQHWLVRFTRRKARSKWSEINRRRATELLEQGRVRPRGLAQIEAAKADGRWNAAYPPASMAAIPDDLRHALSQNDAAAAFFATLTGANRYAILYRIAVVKKPETRARKIAEYVAMLERHETLHG